VIPTKNQFWKDRLSGKRNNKTVKVEYAEVMSISNGNPTIKFIGEELPSSKKFKLLKSYTPAIGEWVQIVDDVIQGGLK